MTVELVCGSGAWCRVWHIPGRCRQPPPLRLGHGQGAGHLPRSPHKVRLVPRAPPPLRPVAGVLLRRRPPPRPSLIRSFLPHPCGAAPASQSISASLRFRPPRPPAAARPRVCKAPHPASGTGFLRQPVPAAPVAAAAAHHSGSCLAFVASAPKSAAPSSRSRRLRCCQGIPPIKSFGRWRPARQQHRSPPKLFPGPHLDNCSPAACLSLLVLLRK